MWLILLCLLAIGGTNSRARPSDQYTDTLKGYYHDYRLMDDRQLQGELTLVWFTIAGGAYYNLKELVSTDCSNASVAAATLWQELSTLEDSTPLIAGALNNAAADIRITIESRSALHHPMEVVCRHLEKRLLTNATLHARFVRLKQTAKVDPRDGPPAAASNHRESANASSLDHVNTFYVFWLSMPRIGQIVAHATFANYLTSSINNCSSEYRLAKSIIQLSKSEKLRVIVQNLYDKVRQDTIRLVIDKVAEGGQDGHKVPVFRLVKDAIMVKLKQEFEAHPKLGVELDKLTKQVDSDNCEPGNIDLTTNTNNK